MTHGRITVDPARMGGLPTIRDTRVTVPAVLGQLAAGRTVAQIVDDYPYLDRKDVLAALAFAAHLCSGPVFRLDLPRATAPGSAG